MEVRDKLDNMGMRVDTKHFLEGSCVTRDFSYRIFAHVRIVVVVRNGFDGALNGRALAARPIKHGCRALTGQRGWHKCRRGADGGRGPTTKQRNTEDYCNDG